MNDSVKPCKSVSKVTNPKLRIYIGDDDAFHPWFVFHFFFCVASDKLIAALREENERLLQSHPPPPTPHRSYSQEGMLIRSSLDSDLVSSTVGSDKKQDLQDTLSLTVQSTGLQYTRLDDNRWSGTMSTSKGCTLTKTKLLESLFKSRLFVSVFLFRCASGYL